MPESILYFMMIGSYLIGWVIGWCAGYVVGGVVELWRSNRGKSGSSV